MLGAVYNSAILKMKLVKRALPILHCCVALCFVLSLAIHALASPATNWSEPEQQLARKIVALTGPGAVALTVENRSSLNKRESEIVGNGLRAALEALGIRFVTAESAAAAVSIFLSENQSSYVWVAEVRQGAGDAANVMVSTPREGPILARDSVPMELRKTPLWKQQERILDVAVLEESTTPTHIAVLNSEHVTLYRWQGAKWEQEQSLNINHRLPWPRDLRGRLIPEKDHLLDVYLPGVLCRTTSGSLPALNCRENDDPWPLVGRDFISGLTAGQRNGANTAAPLLLNAFFAPTRNFFTGVVSPRIGKFSTIPKFYSLAFIPRDKYVLWLFAAVDGQVHIIGGVSDLTVKQTTEKSAWGSDLATIRTPCGAGWQVLAVSAGDQPSEEQNQEDSIRAYEFPDRDPVAVSAAVDVPGEVTALWTEEKGDSAIAVARHRETGEYEAFRLAVSCGQ